MGNFRIPPLLSDSPERVYVRQVSLCGVIGGEKNFMTAPPVFPPGDAGVVTAARSNSSGDRYPNAECIRKRL